MKKLLFVASILIGALMAKAADDAHSITFRGDHLVNITAVVKTDPYTVMISCNDEQVWGVKSNVEVSGNELPEWFLSAWNIGPMEKRPEEIGLLPVVGVVGAIILLFSVITIPGYGIAVYVEYRVAKKMGAAFAKGGPFQTAAMLQVLAPLCSIFLYPLLPGSTYKPAWFGISDRWANTAGIAGLLGVLALARGVALIVRERRRQRDEPGVSGPVKAKRDS
jgi:hypothetical protein